jgi:hypothetical protein
MAKPLLVTTITRAYSDIQRLEVLLNRASGLPAQHQHLIGEVLMVRLFSVLETTFGDVATRLCCGVVYSNGRAPVTMKLCKSIKHSENEMINYRRSPKRRLRYLQWTTSSSIKKNLEYLLHRRDPYLINIDLHNSSIEEMRKVRNHIVHISKKTRDDYKSVLRATYGSVPKITVGAFLTSNTRSSLTNIERYIQTSKVIITDITRGH